MKRIGALVLLISILLTVVLCLPISATEALAEEETEEKIIQNDVLSFSCTYDDVSKKVTVNGTINHDTFASHKESTLLIFLVPPGMSEYDVALADGAEPLAQTGASVNFGFSFKADGFVDRYSRYAIFLKSPDGELTLGTQAQYAEVLSDVTADSEKNHFKGLSSSFSFVAAEIDAGSVIVDVCPNRLFTDKTSGYIYQNDNTRLFFDKAYVDELDSKINSAAISGARIYLRFLFENGVYFSVADSTEGSYIIPNLYDSSTLLLVHSLTEFLIERYNTQENKAITGIIAGKAWDCYQEYNFYPDLTLESYAELCGFYATVLSNAARSIDSSIDIVLPFSTLNFNAGAEYAESGCYDTDALISLLLAYFDNSFVSGFECSFLLETQNVPFGITNDSLSNGIDTENAADELWAGNHQAFSAFLGETAQKYSSTPNSFIYLWIPPADLKGNALCSAYAYSYYALLGEATVSAFVTEFSDKSGNSNNLFDLSYVLKHIDTVNSFSATKDLLAFFGKANWSEIKGITAEASGKKFLYSVSPSFSLPEGIKGKFLYCGFNDSLFTDGWYRGVGCELIKIDYGKEENKALKADMSFASSQRGELIYDYEYHENMAYTPYLSFSFKVEDTSEDSLYEIKLLCENPQTRIESSAVINGNEERTVILDLSNIAAFGTVGNIRISVRSLNSDVERCSLWLYEINGYSTKYTDEELNTLISNERNKIKNDSSVAEEIFSMRNIIFAVAIVLISALLLIGVLLGIRKEHNVDD